MDLSSRLVILPILFFSVIIHEIAHGWVALRRGDPTARDAGRLTLNPLPHIDPVMTILLPLLLLLSGSGIVIGGARPVPVNPANFRRREVDNLLVSGAGAVGNLLLALVAFLFTWLVLSLHHYLGGGLLLALWQLANLMIMINLVLANFNLLPIPPLDGSHLLRFFLRGRIRVAYLQLYRYGFMILLLVILFGNRLPIPGGLLRWIFAPSTWLMEKILHLQVQWLGWGG